MLPEDTEHAGDLVDEFLRYLRGRGPRPQTDDLPLDERTELENTFRLLEAIVDTNEAEVPPIEEDPIAVRLGLVAGKEQINADTASSGPLDAAGSQSPQ